MAVYVNVYLFLRIFVPDGKNILSSELFSWNTFSITITIIPLVRSTIKIPIHWNMYYIK